VNATPWERSLELDFFLIATTEIVCVLVFFAAVSLGLGVEVPLLRRSLTRPSFSRRAHFLRSSGLLDGKQTIFLRFFPPPVPVAPETGRCLLSFVLFRCVLVLCVVCFDFLFCGRVLWVFVVPCRGIVCSAARSEVLRFWYRRRSSLSSPSGYPLHLLAFSFLGTRLFHGIRLCVFSLSVDGTPPLLSTV